MEAKEQLKYSESEYKELYLNFYHPDEFSNFWFEGRKQLSHDAQYDTRSFEYQKAVNELYDKITKKNELKKSDVHVDNIEWKDKRGEIVEEELSEFAKKAKEFLNMKNPIIVHLYKGQDGDRGEYDEGVILLYEQTPDWRGDFCHELGHQLIRQKTIDSEPTCKIKLEKIKREMEKSKGDGRIFVQPHTYSTIKEVAVTFFKWWLLGKIVNEAYLSALNFYHPDSERIIEKLMKSDEVQKSFDIIKSKKSWVKQYIKKGHSVHSHWTTIRSNKHDIKNKNTKIVRILEELGNNKIKRFVINKIDDNIPYSKQMIDDIISVIPEKSLKIIYAVNKSNDKKTLFDVRFDYKDIDGIIRDLGILSLTFYNNIHRLKIDMILALRIGSNVFRNIGNKIVELSKDVGYQLFTNPGSMKLARAYYSFGFEYEDQKKRDIYNNCINLIKNGEADLNSLQNYFLKNKLHISNMIYKGDKMPNIVKKSDDEIDQELFDMPFDEFCPEGILAGSKKSHEKTMDELKQLANIQGINLEI
jgi:hypothetical protein